MKVAVVGAGISGLAAAVSLRRHAKLSTEVVVFEREAEVGGRARSRREDDFLVERGPNAFLGRDEVVLELTRLAGLEPRPAAGASARRLLYRAGALRELRPHPLALLRRGVLSPIGLLRALAEPWRPVGSPGESVEAFARRRFGPQVAERLFAPMVAGVFAGDPARLELDSAFPVLREWEQRHGSVIRGVARRRREPGAAEAGRLLSFDEGMGSLSRELVRAEGLDVRRSAGVEAIARLEPRGFRLRVDGSWMEVDAVVVACDLPAGAELLAGLAPGVSAELASLPTPPLSVVSLGYRRRPAGLPTAYGALILRDEGVAALGMLFESELFPGRGPEGGALVRAMFGGRLEPEAAAASDEALVARAVEDLRRLSGAPMPAPDHSSVTRWPAAIPQYELGHAGRVARIEEALRGIPGLELAGNALSGVAFGKAAQRGWEVGRSIARVAGEA